MTQVEVFADPAHDLERLRSFEVGRTPTPVVEQRIALLDGRWRKTDRIRVLDPSAGSGVFAMVIRRHYPRAHIVSVEARPEERPHLERHSDEVILERFEDALPYLRTRPRFHLIATNPPFRLMRPRQKKEAIERESWLDPLRWLLQDTLASSLVLLLRADAFWRKEADARWFAQVHHGSSRFPREEHKVPGRIAFYGGTATANETHSWMGWGHPLIGAGGPWPTSILPTLEPAQLMWKIPPGQEK